MPKQHLLFLHRHRIIYQAKLKSDIYMATGGKPANTANWNYDYYLFFDNFQTARHVCVWPSKWLLTDKQAMDTHSRFQESYALLEMSSEQLSFGINKWLKFKANKQTKKNQNKWHYWGKSVIVRTAVIWVCTECSSKYRQVSRSVTSHSLRSSMSSTTPTTK